MRLLNWGIVGAAFFLSACTVQPAGEQSTEPQGFVPEVAIPDDGNHYIVPRTTRDVYLRPSRSSPEIGRIYSSVSSPRPVQVYSKLERPRGGYWWEIRHQDQTAYISTFDGSLAPYIATDLPPDMDLSGGYEEEILLITGIHPSRPNSAGGVDAHIGLINPATGNTVKYVVFDISPYNQVGDRVSGGVRNADRARLRITGPIEADGSEKWSAWENVFYNHSIVCAVINAVEIEYMDDSTRRITGNELADILHSDVDNDCSY